MLGQKLASWKKRVSVFARLEASLSGKATLNAAASMVDYFARMAVSLLINPVLVAGLGDYLFGVWQILGRLMGYVAIAGGRPTQALKLTIAKQQSFENYDEKRRQVGSSLYSLLLFTPFFLITGLVLIWLAPEVLRARPEYVLPIRVATGLLVANVFLVSVSDLPRSVLEGQNLGYKRLGLTTFLVVLGGAMMWAAVALDLGLVGVALVTVGITALTGTLFWTVTKHHVPWFGLARPSYAEVRRFFGLTGWFFVWQIVILLLDGGDVLILGLLDSAERVTSYSLTKSMAFFLVSLVSVIITSIIPGLGGILGKEDFHNARIIRSDMLTLTWLIVVATGTTILAWNETFVSLWVGDQYYAGFLENMLIIIMVAQWVFIRNDSNIIDLNLTLRHKNLLGLLAVSISISTSAILILVWERSILAMCLGFILGRLILNISYPWLVFKILHIRWRQALLETIRPIIATLMVVVVLVICRPWLIAENWFSLALYSGLTFVSILSFSFLIGITREQKKRLMKRVNHLY